MNLFDFFPFFSFIILLVILASRAIFLLKKKVPVYSKNEEKKGSKIFLSLLFLILFLIWLFEISKPVFQFSISILPKFFTNILIESNYLNVVGGIILLFSLILLLITLLHFKTSLRFGFDKNQPGKLITTGVFSISRNPFFLSLVFYFSGISFIFPTLFFILFTLLALIGIHFFILKEEKFMTENYGEEYKKYSQKVRRYF